eukprot:1158126-Pelagomonas_calceolata.AAC.11
MQRHMALQVMYRHIVCGGVPELVVDGGHQIGDESVQLSDIMTSGPRRVGNLCQCVHAYMCVYVRSRLPNMSNYLGPALAPQAPFNTFTVEMPSLTVSQCESALRGPHFGMSCTCFLVFHGKQFAQSKVAELLIWGRTYSKMVSSRGAMNQVGLAEMNSGNTGSPVPAQPCPSILDGTPAAAQRPARWGGKCKTRMRYKNTHAFTLTPPQTPCQKGSLAIQQWS